MPMLRCEMYRRGDLSLTHNPDQANHPDEVQFEGVMFTDGTVAVRWRTAINSTSVWKSMKDLMAIHGHPEYQSELVWLDSWHPCFGEYDSELLECEECDENVQCKERDA
jgi:hypothetical protein